VEKSQFRSATPAKIGPASLAKPEFIVAVWWLALAYSR
jgi:hypothetical protein